MTRRLLLSAVALAAALGIAACDSKTNPSLNLDGAWTGSLTFVTSGVTVTDSVTTTLSQSSSSVTGSWTTQGGTTGQFTLTLDGADVGGTTTISQTTITGQVCNGSTQVTGTAENDHIELALTTIAPAGVCQWATNQQFVLTR